ncbi:hypothetical protein NP233_g905 [Leucocoprinus birnbaumii]|uniref:Uncharacterized protein n=1 Tax=Leucocoprinus birnbaumii TaxID=56174 RepID=A0AAD5W3G9_9AGAR|nr:hypothetical protein NP233_g905 [Leucocoprinus birnbaumii]
MAAPIMSAMPPVRHSIDLKANGEVSRMRNHKGNMPSLPQTKYCSLCPAKFTRTTHLNRHLRSHTNERLHRCNTCSAEFTRSDLLTRHKRTCGDSRNANKSRRKSCQACAESKVKCNLQYPCSKCSSRGRECVFINDPETSRNKRIAAKKAAAAKAVAEASSPTSTSSQAMSSPPYPSLFVPTNSTPSPTLSLDGQLLPTLDLPGLSTSSSSSIASTRSSPRSDLFEPRGDFAQSFDVAAFDSLGLDSHLGRLFPGTSSAFENFGLDQSMSSSSPPSAPMQDLSAWLDGGDGFSKFGPGDIFSFPPSIRLEGQIFSSDYAPLPPSTPLRTPPSQPSSTIDSSRASFDSSGMASPREPSPEDLEHYLYLFFSAFGTQIPIIHPSTWNPEGKPQILIRAMQACGALFVKTKTAMNFINNTLVATRDTLILEFSNSSSDLSQQMYIIVAAVLLQTIGLFHQKSDQRVSSNVYHGMLVMMIRRIGLINRISSWTPPDLSDASMLEKAWKDWAQYETVKRALLVSYLHDCCHCLYFSMSPSFQTNEIDICLPCDDGLWVAGSATQWLQTAKSPSQYGHGLARLSGFNMQRALAILSEPQPTVTPPALNPFAHFILIHTILRNLYTSYARDHADAPSPNDSSNIKGVTFSTQFSLHTWLQMWMNSPDAIRYDNSREEPPFMYNALPFYWLAQVSLMALQDEDVKPMDRKTESRYRLMKEWLDRIKSHLRGGTQIPTQLWDELMKVRLQLRLRPDQGKGEHPGGLTAFLQTA